VRFMAEQRGVSEAELARTLYDNAQRAFGPW
jgi:Tat protein secretion system quality control protein TatD with DNase activity